MTRKINPAKPDDLDEVAAAWIFKRDAGLSAAEREELGRWQAADPRHREAWARHEKAWLTFDRPRLAGQADVLMGRLATRAAARRRRTATVSVALAGLLVAGGVWSSRRLPTEDSLTPRMSVVMPQKQTLPDGSVVELKSDAEIAVDFNGPLRRVSLHKGEAHFQVVKNSRPFVVVAGDIEFRAVGTAFAVQVAGQQVELLVTEGRVAVEKTADRPPTAQATLTPAAVASPPETTVDAGSRLVIDAAPSARLPRPTVVPGNEMAERLAWRVPKLEFTETPLTEAVTLMNQHNRVQLRVDDPELGRLPVSGLFRADRVDAFVSLLETNFDAKAERSHDLIRLQRKR